MTQLQETIYYTWPYTRGSLVHFGCRSSFIGLMPIVVLAHSHVNSTYVCYRLQLT